MKDWIIIPDLHGRRFWRDAVSGHEDENIVFLGDYLDPYSWEGITHDTAYAELLDIIAFKKEHPDNVVLLLGNHDLSYIDRLICDCRRDSHNAERNRILFEDNMSLFELSHETQLENGQKVLFSHAGVRAKWVWFNEWFFKGNFSVKALNDLLHDPSRREEMSALLRQVSYLRGGLDQYGSCVWADLDEYKKTGDFLPGYMHVFGHTLHEGPTGLKTRVASGWCLDCGVIGFRLDGNGQMGLINEDGEQ